MQTSELRDLLREMGEQISPPSPDLWEHITRRARRHRIRQRATKVVVSLAACAAVTVPVVAVSSGDGRQVVTVGRPASPSRSRTVPQVIVNVLSPYRQAQTELDKITKVALKEMTWSEFTSKVPQFSSGEPASVGLTPTSRVYVILQTGSNHPAHDGPDQPLYHWVLYVQLVGESTSFTQDPGWPTITRHGPQPATLQPPFWTHLPGTEYDLYPTTGKITIARTGN